MSTLHFPWIELSVALPFLGACCLPRANAEYCRKLSLAISALTLLATSCAWVDFQTVSASNVCDPWGLLSQGLGWEPLVIDRLSAPLLPLIALLFFLTRLATARTKIIRFPFKLNLLMEATALAAYASKESWLIIALLTLEATIPLIEIQLRGRSCRVYLIYMSLFVALMVGGQCAREALPANLGGDYAAVVALTLAMLIRGGIAPFHSWIPDLFDRAAFGTALLFVTPLAGAYGLLRLVVPFASDQLLHFISLAAMATALYASAMALAQREGRNFFSFLLISHGAVVIAGLLTLSQIAVVGGLCVWLSTTISLGGLGLTLRALEARRGRLSMRRFQGLYDHAPNLAMCFALTGLASVGFPGTFGFIGTELLIDGSVESQSFVGIVLVIVAAMNGIAVMQAFLRLFGGTEYFSSVSLGISRRERFAVLLLAALILVGGFFPQWIVTLRSQAADDLLTQRAARMHHDDLAGH